MLIMNLNLATLLLHGLIRVFTPTFTMVGRGGPGLDSVTLTFSTFMMMVDYACEYGDDCECESDCNYDCKYETEHDYATDYDYDYDSDYDYDYGYE